MKDELQTRSSDLYCHHRRVYCNITFIIDIYNYVFSYALADAPMQLSQRRQRLLLILPGK